MSMRILLPMSLRRAVRGNVPAMRRSKNEMRPNEGDPSACTGRWDEIPFTCRTLLVRRQ